MGHIIFDLLIVLADILVIFDKDSPETLKRLALLAIILLMISIILRLLNI